MAAAAFAATGVSIDTRTLEPGDLFVALRASGDGHDFVAEALAKGAAGAMVHRDLPAAARRRCCVSPTRWPALQALGGAAPRALRRPAACAVTGSVGKTTHQGDAAAVLAALGPTHAAVTSYNNHWGVPLTLARMPRGRARSASPRSA